MQSDHYEAILKQIGSSIRQIRVAKGLTMETTANEAGMEYRQLGRIERGEVNTTVTSLLKIADALNVEVTEFFKNNR